MTASITGRPAALSPPLTARRAGSGAALPVALWLGAAVVSGFSARRYLGPLDEGVLLQAASRMADGQWPWRDFGWAYGPGEPLLLAGAFKVLGASAWWWRVLRVAADATAAVLVWALVRDGSERPRWALAAWAAAAVTAAQPTNANPTAPALAFALAALLLATRDRPAWAGAAAAATAFWRPDLGACAAVAAAASLALGARPPRPVALGRSTRGPGGLGTLGGQGGLATLRRPARGGGPSRPAVLTTLGRSARSPRAARSAAAALGPPPVLAAAVCLAVAVLVAAILYAPFLIAAGPGRAWDFLVVQARHDGAWWSLPFPAGYPGRLRGWPPGSLARDLKDVAYWLLPYVALLIAAIGALVLVARRGAGARALPGLVVLAAGAFAYLLSRADDVHAQPLIVIACALAPIAAAAAPVPVRALLAAALALILATGAANRLSALLRPPHLATLHLARLDALQVPPADARALPRLVALVDRLVPPGEPIYVAPRRSDLVTRTNPLLHFIVDRPNVLDRDVLLQAKPAEQERIVAALRRAQPRVVIRWTDPASSKPEPNRRGRSSGSRALDRYLATAYRPRARFGFYTVLVPRH